MVEAVVLEITRPRIVAEHQPLDPLPVFRGADDEVALRARDGRERELARAHLAVARVWVRRHEAGDRLALPLPDPLQRRVGRRDLPRVVFRLRRIGDSQLIRLGLMVAAVLEEEEPQALGRDAAERPELGHEDRARDQAHRSDLLLRHLLRGVPRRDVAGLVTQHARQLGLRVHVRQDSPRDVDVAAGDRERVHDRRVEEAVMPLEVRQVRGLADALADPVHVFGERGVSVEAVLGDDRRVGVLAHLELFVLRDEGDLPLAGRGIGGAAGVRREEDGEQGQRESAAACREPLSVAHSGDSLSVGMNCESDYDTPLAGIRIPRTALRPIGGMDARHFRGHRAALRQHHQVSLGRRRGAREVGPSGGAHGRRRHGVRALGQVPSFRSVRPGVGQPRPVRPLGGPRLDAPLFAPPPLWIRPAHGRAPALPPVGIEDAGAPGARDHARRGSDDRPSGAGLRQRRGHGAGPADGAGPVSAPRAASRRPGLRHRERRRSHGGRGVGGGLARGALGSWKPRLPL